MSLISHLVISLSLPCHLYVIIMSVTCQSSFFCMSQHFQPCAKFEGFKKRINPTSVIGLINYSEEEKLRMASQAKTHLHKLMAMKLRRTDSLDADEIKFMTSFPESIFQVFNRENIDSIFQNEPFEQIFNRNYEIFLPNIYSVQFPGFTQDQYAEMTIETRLNYCAKFSQFFDTKTQKHESRFTRFVKTVDYFHNQERANLLDLVIKDCLRKVTFLTHSHYCVRT